MTSPRVPLTTAFMATVANWGLFLHGSSPRARPIDPPEDFTVFPSFSLVPPRILRPVPDSQYGTFEWYRGRIRVGGEPTVQQSLIAIREMMDEGRALRETPRPPWTEDDVQRVIDGLLEDA